MDPDQELADMLHGGAAMKDMSLQQQRNAAEDLMGNFADLAARLAALEGQKHVVYFSLGFQSSLILSSGGIGHARTGRVLEEMFHVFRSAGVFLDTVDIAGVRVAPGPDNDTLGFMAHNTGGEFVHNRNDLAGGLLDMTKSQQVVYVLAFHRRDRRGGTIDVRVNGVPRGTTLSFRQGFGAAERSRTVDPLQLADILTNDIPQTDLDLRLESSPSEVTVEVSRERVIQLAGNASTVDLLLYVYDANGSVIYAGERTIPCSETMIARARVELRPGSYQAKALARIHGTNFLGFARSEFNIPAP